MTPVPGKGPLTEGADYSLAYDGAACELTFNALSSASVIGVGERLILSYRARLDADFQYGTNLTNVAGATQWYNAQASNPLRTAYTRTLTDGTVGTLDHEDAHTVIVVPRMYAEKAAALQVDGSSPGIVDPGDVLRYTIRVYNNGAIPITQAMLRDAVPANTTYVANSLTLNGLPVGQPESQPLGHVFGRRMHRAGRRDGVDDRRGRDRLQLAVVQAIRRSAVLRPEAGEGRRGGPHSQRLKQSPRDKILP